MDIRAVLWFHMVLKGFYSFFSVLIADLDVLLGETQAITAHIHTQAFTYQSEAVLFGFLRWHDH